MSESKMKDVLVHCSSCDCNALPSQGNDTDFFTRAAATKGFQTSGTVCQPKPGDDGDTTLVQQTHESSHFDLLQVHWQVRHLDWVPTVVVVHG